MKPEKSDGDQVCYECFTWKEYAKSSPDALTEDAIALRENILQSFDDDLLAAIIIAKQKKFSLDTGGGSWLPIDITRSNAFHILNGVIRCVRELGGDVSVRDGLTRVAWSDTNTAA